MEEEEGRVPRVRGHGRGRRSSAVVVALALLFVAGCKKSDEEQIRRVIERAVSHANEKSVSGVCADAGEGFVGPHGADLGEVKRVLLGFFMGQGWIVVLPRGIDVEIEDGTHASAVLRAGLAKGPEVKKPADLVPVAAELMRFDFVLEKQHGDWKLVKAEYTPER